MQSIFYAVLFVCIFCCSEISFAQRDTVKHASAQDTIHHPNRPYTALQFLHETHLFIKQPTGWKGKNWLMFSGAAAGTALSTLLDKPMRSSTQGNQHFFYSFWIEGGRIY